MGEISSSKVTNLHCVKVIGLQQSGDKKSLVCPVTSEKHVIEASSDLMSRNPSWYFTNLPDLVAIVIVVVKVFSL